MRSIAVIVSVCTHVCLFVCVSRGMEVRNVSNILDEFKYFFLEMRHEKKDTILR